MAYETASATGPNDLLDKLRVFAAANGWTVDYHGPRTNAGGASQGNGLNALAITKAGVSWVIYHSTAVPSQGLSPGPFLCAYMHPGPWVASAGTDLQASRSQLAIANNLGGPYVGYHFFTDSARAYLHVAVEVASGRFGHIMLGHLDRTAASGVAAYAAALQWDYGQFDINQPTSGNAPFDSYSSGSAYHGGGIIRADSDGIVPRYLRMNTQTSTQAEEARGVWRLDTDGQIASGPIRMMAPSSLTGRAVLVPCMVSVSRGGNQNNQSILGAPYDLRLVRIDNLTPGDVMTIGSDQWKCFPVIRKNGGPGLENSLNWGYAYRVVP
jgi:hypothetical protein